MCQFFVHYSFHEMGVYDLPAVIDYVLKATGTQKLHYVGHSMGTTMFYVLLSERPQYNSKILAMFSLAPAAFLSHMTNPLKAFFFNGGLKTVEVCHSTKLNIQITELTATN
jgi:pimeloyl-ACP methyl ester carboxylesterase